MEVYCNYKLSLLLKQHGFNEPCEADYFCEDSNGVMIGIPKYNEYMINGHCCAPSQAQALKWLREEKQCPIEILWHYDHDSQVEEWYFRHHVQLRELPAIEYYDTYEEAEEAAIKYCLDNII